MDIFWFVAIIAILLAIKFVLSDRRADKMDKAQLEMMKMLSKVMQDMGIIFANLAVIIPTIPKEKYDDVLNGMMKIVVEKKDIKDEKQEEINKNINDKFDEIKKQ